MIGGGGGTNGGTQGVGESEVIEKEERNWGE